MSIAAAQLALFDEDVAPRAAPGIVDSAPVPPAGFSFLPGTRPEEGSALVVNIFGGPGVGKSTIASRIFAALKERGIEAACPEEHAKLAIWSGQPWLVEQQPILLGRTWETIQALLDKVDVIIVDSPILLCSVYAGDREPDCFHALCADMHCRSNRLNILLRREDEADYSSRGRLQDLGEAMEFDRRIETCLARNGEQYTGVIRGAGTVEQLAAAIQARMAGLLIAA